MVSWRALAARSAHMDMAPRPCASLGVNSHFRAARCLAAALCVRSAVSVGIWVPPRGRRNIQVSGGVRVCVRAQRCEPRRPMDKEPRRVSQRVRPECVKCNRQVNACLPKLHTSLFFFRGLETDTSSRRSQGAVKWSPAKEGASPSRRGLH